MFFLPLLQLKIHFHTVFHFEQLVGAIILERFEYQKPLRTSYIANLLKTKNCKMIYTPYAKLFGKTVKIVGISFKSLVITALEIIIQDLFPLLLKDREIDIGKMLWSSNEMTKQCTCKHLL